MNRLLGALVMLVMGLAVIQPAEAVDFPTPSIYPVAWQFDFSHSQAERIVVTSPIDNVPVAYWYITYKVTNNTSQERMFLPEFLMLSDNGSIKRANDNIPPQVFAAIQKRASNPFLKDPNTVAGKLLIGEDEARESAAIWVEPDPRMGKFSIFVGGLSGETAQITAPDGQALKDSDGNPVVLRKTLQLNYHILGDEVFPGEDEVHTIAEQWIMR